MIKKGWLMRRLSISEPHARDPLLRTATALAELHARSSSYLRIKQAMNTKQCGCNDGLDFDRGLVAYLPESFRWEQQL
jgi:hypothetical protein